MNARRLRRGRLPRGGRGRMRRRRGARTPRRAPAARALALALALAGAGELADLDWARDRRRARSATVAIALLVLARLGRRSTGCRGSTRSWARPPPPALAVALGAGAAPAVGAGGVAARPRACAAGGPGRTVAARARRASPRSAAGPWLAPRRGALAMAAAAWLPRVAAAAGRRSSARSCSRRSSPSPRPRSCLLTVGQFTEHRPTVAVALATATVLTGMARAGLTVVERLRESAHAGADRRPDRARQPPPPRRHAARHDRVGARAGRRARAAARSTSTASRSSTTRSATTPATRCCARSARACQALLRERRHARPARRRRVRGRPRSPATRRRPAPPGCGCARRSSESFAVGGIHVHIDASVGIALFPAPLRATRIGLLQRADVAMYQAKRMRTGHEVYLAGARPPQPPAARARGRAATRALEAGELVLHYQPQAELRTGARARRRGARALGAPASAGCSAPSHFLPLVEQSGLTRALTAVRARPRAGRRSGDAAPARPSSSASRSTSGPPTCSTSACRRRSSGCSSTTASPRTRCELEVSEDIVMADVERTVDVLVGLRAIGVRDRARRLRRRPRRARAPASELHVDVLKIDRSFVMRRRAATSATPRSCTRWSTSAAGSGVRVVAEGVDSRRGLRAASACGAATRSRATSSPARCRLSSSSAGCSSRTRSTAPAPVGGSPARPEVPQRRRGHPPAV